MHSSDSVVPVSDSRSTSGWYRNHRLLFASLTGSERRGTSSAALGLVPSPRRPSGCRLLIASLTGSERRGTSSIRPIPADGAPCRDDMLLSPKIFAHGGEDSSTRQTSSSTTHSVTGPVPSAPSASTVENPANALPFSVPWIQFCVYLVYFYLHICFLLIFQSSC